MSNQNPFTLQERVPLKNTLQRVLDILILTLLFSLLIYRLFSLDNHGSVWLAAFICECWFTFVWVLFVNAKWTLAIYKTYPQRLTDRFDDLPAIDIFVATADPNLEPPIVTVNTVLSLLAVEFPPHKLACYVSDDGGSPFTFYALSEASKFARLWVPFCKRYNVRVRAPFVYFSAKPEESSEHLLPEEFLKEWKNMKNEYENLSRRIEQGGKNILSHNGGNDDGELAEFANIERGNHESIIKVILENTELEGGIPHVIYVAREKRPTHPHHYKAGAMNVLTRVSGVMTNAPFMLNVDCDMFSNNPEILLHGMCLLLGFDNEVFSGFVQTMQQIHGGLKDDPFGNQMEVFQLRTILGMGGIQGPIYIGTGCIHRRKIIYGSPPQELTDANENRTTNENPSYEELRRAFGYSRELVESVKQIISRKANGSSFSSSSLMSKVEAAKEVAACTYEFNTGWGKEIGWVYGSMTEDVVTGLKIHAMGWRSVLLTPDRPAFLGSPPTGGPASLTQQKRWATGVLEVMLGRNSPILAFLAHKKKLRFRQCLAYLPVMIWGVRSPFELSYALLPAYCLLTDAAFLPKLSEWATMVPISLFVIINVYNLIEYRQCGFSARACWNNQRMMRVYAITAWLFGLLTVVLKTLGISETTFEVTKKEQNSPSNGNGDEDENENDKGRFTFDGSPVFVSGTALVLVHLTSIAVGLLRLYSGGGRRGPGFGEFLCSGLVLLIFWPFVRGLVGKGSYGIPWSVILKAGLLVLGFLSFSRWSQGPILV